MLIGDRETGEGLARSDDDLDRARGNPKEGSHRIQRCKEDEEGEKGICRNERIQLRQLCVLICASHFWDQPQTKYRQQDSKDHKGTGCEA